MVTVPKLPGCEPWDPEASGTSAGQRGGTNVEVAADIAAVSSLAALAAPRSGDGAALRTISLPHRRTPCLQRLGRRHERRRRALVCAARLPLASPAGRSIEEPEPRGARFPIYPSPWRRGRAAAPPKPSSPEPDPRLQAAARPRTTRFGFSQGAPTLRDPAPGEPGYLPPGEPTLTATARAGLSGVLGATQAGICAGPPGLGRAGDPTVAPKVTGVDHWSGVDATAAAIRPRWLAHDREVLRFYGFWREPVIESAVENFRTRRATVFYYLEDDTVHVGEPREDNAGLPQGVFLRRGAVERPDGTQLTHADLVVGGDLPLYGRVIHLVGCDAFTRKFKADRGVTMPADSDAPSDPHRDRLAARAAAATKGRPPTQERLALRKLAQFFKHGGRVLRFWAAWDDRASLCGDLQPLVLHYFLEDDTIEVNEVRSRNDGKDAFPRLLARGKVPHDHAQAATGAGAPGARYEGDVYHWKDLAVGATINVYGRPLLLYDCDGFTRSWYVDRNGADPAAWVPRPDLVGEEAALDIPKFPVAPDWYGIGTERDQMQSVNLLVPRPPRPDWSQFMRHGGETLRFAARLTEGPGEPNIGRVLPGDEARVFVVSYYLSDDTIQVYEPPVRNSGQPGGKFLERIRVRKAGSATQDYRARDLVLGGYITTHSRCFELFDADPWTLRYLEEHCAEGFPHADVDRVVGAARTAVGADPAAAAAAVIGCAGDAGGSVSLPEMGALLAGAGLDLGPHELVTIARAANPAEPSGQAPVPAAALADLLGVSLAGAGDVTAAH